MSANLYETKNKGQYYHIHGSLEATTTLKMIGLEPFRPDLITQEDIISNIEPAVQRFTVQELESLNAHHKQAGIPALKYEEFLETAHVRFHLVFSMSSFSELRWAFELTNTQGATNVNEPSWSVTRLEDCSPPVPLPSSRSSSPKILGGIRVLELCRIIAGPTIARILAEYGADVLKVTGPGLSDVPFFQIDGNMGKHATEIDLKSAGGRAVFEMLLQDADIVIDGYRPGALEKLGYGHDALAKFAEKRGKGIVYVNENCFGYVGEWANRPGWQQIADCVRPFKYPVTNLYINTNYR